MLEPTTELSKSHLFAIHDGSLVVASQPYISACQLDGPIGNIIDQKYHVLSVLGEGGMGAVYRARHLMLDKEVALKTFRHVNLNEEAIVRFQREAQAIAKVNHKNVVQIFDFGLSSDGVPYYTMEYLLGQSLAEKLAESGSLAVPEACELFIQICHGLAIAHDKGIIHRDVKPANVFVETSPGAKGKVETAKLVDFGIASLARETPMGVSVTSGGIVLGSPLYMSPEQSMGAAVTESADIYSLGCTLFEALVGSAPFCGSSALETMMLHQTARVPTLKEASGGQDYPPALEIIVATMLAKFPGDRQSTIGLVAAQLSELRSEHQAIESRGIRTHRQVRHSQDLFVNSRSTRAAKTVFPSAPCLLQICILLVGGVAGFCCQGVKSHSAIPTSQKQIAATVVPTRAAGIKGSMNSRVTEGQISLPYCKTQRTADGIFYFTFKFPDDLDLGVFENAQFTNGHIHAIGEVTWGQYQAPLFRPSEKFLENISNFDVFGPNHLSGLDLVNWRTSQPHSRLMPRIGQMTGLRILELDDAEIGDSDLTELVNLRQLNTLSLISTNIHGAAIAKLPQLKQLISVCFSSGQGASDLLAALKGTSCLKYLFIDNTPLTAADFKTIATFSNLERLQVNNSGMHDADLVALSSLTKLNCLAAQRCEITPQTIKTLQVMKKNGLTYLTLSDANWSPEDMENVRHMLQRTRFTDQGFSKNDGATSDMARMLE